MNILHTFFALGSFSAPFLVSFFIGRGKAWDYIFSIMGTAAIIIGVLILLSNIPAPVKNSPRRKSGFNNLFKKYINVFKEKSFRSLWLISMMALGVQFGLIYLLVSYFIRILGISYREANLMMSAFFLLMLTGRLLCSYLVTKISPYKLILILLTALSVFLISGWLSSGITAEIFLALTGLASSGLIPLLLSISSTTLNEDVRGTALGFIGMAGGTGGMLLTLFITWLSDYISFKYSFLLLLAIAIISLAVFLHFYQCRKKKEQVC